MNTEQKLKTIFTGEIKILLENESYIVFLVPAHLPPDMMGCGNGYVGIKKDIHHELFGLHYMDIEDEIVVHGGLTYSKTLEDGSLHILGFDTGHAGDTLYTWPEDRLINETHFLYSQIKNYAN